MEIIAAVEKGDDPRGFMKGALNFASHLATNTGRSIVRGITRPRGKPSSGGPQLLQYYEGQLSKLAANFAMCADLSLSLGGRIKTEEMLSGRFADAFGTLYLGYACLWYFEQNMKVDGAEQIFALAMETLLQQNQNALVGVADNFPVRPVGWLMKRVCFPLGDTYHGPTDAARKRVSQLITNPTGIRELLMKGIFVSENPQDQFRMLLDAMPKAVQVDAMVAKHKKAKTSLSAEEQKLVDEVTALVDHLIQVSSFDKLGKEKLMDESYVRPAMKGTKFAALKAAVPVAV